MMGGWHFFATRLRGDGTETLLATDLQLSGAKIQRAVSGPGGVAGTLEVEDPRLQQDDGSPVFVKHSTALYAERDGYIYGAGILGEDGLERQGPELAISVTGFSSHPDGTPYDGAISKVQVDPADLIRRAWDHVQRFPGGDVGMVVDEISTDVRLGTESEDVEFETGEGEQVSFEAGPFKWNWWSTHDLGDEIDKLCEDTPIDFLEAHSWRGQDIEHRMILGHPRLGTRRRDLRFVVGENVSVEPAVTGSEWASQVIVLGSGEGRKMKRGQSSERLAGRLRRVHVITDKTLTSDRACNQMAARELRRRNGADEVTRVTVRDFTSTGRWTPGDEIFVQGSGQGWAGEVAGWHRILSDEIDCETDECVLTLERAGKA